jgi:hypothetical protein
MMKELGENIVFGGDMAMFGVGFGLHHGRIGEMQFFGFMILKWQVTHLKNEKRPM